MAHHQTITVTARRAFELGGRVYARGEVLELAPVQAAILRDRGKVAIASDGPVVVSRQAGPETPIPGRSLTRAARRRARQAAAEAAAS